MFHAPNRNRHQSAGKSCPQDVALLNEESNRACHGRTRNSIKASCAQALLRINYERPVFANLAILTASAAESRALVEEAELGLPNDSPVPVAEAARVLPNFV